MGNVHSWLLAVGATVVAVAPAYLVDRPGIGWSLVVAGVALLTVDAFLVARELLKERRAPRTALLLVGATIMFFIGVSVGYLVFGRWFMLPEARTSAELAVEQRYKVYREKLEARNEGLERDLERLHGTLETVERLSGDLKFYVKWNPYVDRNDEIAFGNCGGIPCPTLKLLGIDGTGAEAVIRLQVTPRFPAPIAPFGPFIVRLPLRKGCWRDLINAKGYTLTLTVEGDTYREPQLGVAFARRIGRRPDAPDAKVVFASDWTDYVAFSTPPGRLTCGDAVFVCQEELAVDGNVRAGKKDDIACLSGAPPQQ